MWFYSLTFVVLALLNGIGYLLKQPKITYIISLVLLGIIAAFRPSTCCADYTTYMGYYDILPTLPLTFVEPSFFLISEISRVVFNSSIGIFIIYAILGVGIKGVAFPKLTEFFILTLLLYFGSFFLLHEMTQIRVGISSGVLLLSIPSIVNKDPKAFFMYFVIGCLFHYSFVVVGVFYFLDAKKINPLIYLGMIVFAFLAFSVGLNLVSFLQLIKLGFLSEKINAYKLMLDEGLYGDIQLLNPLLFLRILVFSVLLSKWKVLQERNRYSVILLKLYAFSIFFFIALADLPALAGRISQLIGIVEIILVPFMIYIIRPKYLAIIFSFIFALLIMYKQLYYSNLMQSYF